MVEHRFVDGSPLDEQEVSTELSLRPQNLQQYKNTYLFIFKLLVAGKKLWIMSYYMDLLD